MPKADFKEQSPYFNDEGWFRARVGRCEERTINFTYRANNPQVKEGKKRVGDQGSFNVWDWPFTLLTGAQSGSEIKANTEARISFNPSDNTLNNTASLIFALRGGNGLSEGASVDTDDLAGLEVDVYIKHREPTPKKDKATGAILPNEFWYNSEVSDWAVAGTHTGGQAADPWAAESTPSNFGDEPPF